ncbi:PRC-barrel domain-containing protein, partial [Actinophytocola sp.]|uniref:PRC-barrel domain-containing protein n=1 Tax=Actinophytocola sp. TaxID=1872138 RepID=UPI002D808DF2
MATTTKVFVAQLVGLPVFGPDGESIGKIRDLVVALRIDSTAPRVLGLVIELATRRRIFVPMLRVTAIDPNAITLATGSVNLRRFTSRANEVLVIGQLIDARVRIRSTGATATVLDAAIEPTRTRDWVLCRVAVRERTGRIGRRGPVKVLGWEDVEAPGMTELIHAPQGAVHLLALYDQMRATDVAAAL